MRWEGSWGSIRASGHLGHPDNSRIATIPITCPLCIHGGQCPTHSKAHNFFSPALLSFPYQLHLSSGVKAQRVARVHHSHDVAVEPALPDLGEMNVSPGSSATISLSRSESVAQMNTPMPFCRPVTLYPASQDHLAHFLTRSSATLFKFL